MRSIQYEDLARRKAQWSAFHSWQSQNPAPGLSFEERIQWYVAAFRFTRDVLKRVGVRDLGQKIQDIRDVRKRLAHLG